MDPDPTPDPTPFFSDFKDVNFFHIFSYYLPEGTSFSVLKIKFFAKILRKNFILQALFQSVQHIYEKREGSGAGSGRPQKHADPDPQHCFKLNVEYHT
jgi:hypothetical protein